MAEDLATKANGGMGGGAGGRAAALPGRGMGVWRFMGVILAVLVGSFILQIPGHRVADWQLFAVYDPGTVMKGEWLMEKGYVPAVDFGYTHGLISLLYGEVVFGALGLNAWAYLLGTFLVEVGIAYAMARLVRALHIAADRLALILFLLALPMAIMPAYLTFTHVLEALLILLALAYQAEGSRSRALAVMAVCVFVKPSMGYVYGFLLICLLAWEYRGRRWWVNVAKELIPAAATFVLVFVLLWGRFGLEPVVRTVVPLTGATTYAVTHFGFFNESGLNFWLPYRDQPASIWAIIAAYLGVYIPTPNVAYRGDYWAPIGMFLLASLVSAIAAVAAAARLLRIPPSAGRSGVASPFEMLFTVGALNTIFLLTFFGWPGSWAYYSYLPVIGMILAAMMLPLKNLARGGLFATLIALMFLSHAGLFIESFGAWGGKERTASGMGADPGLYDWPTKPDKVSLLDQLRKAVEYVGKGKTVVMTDGWLPHLPENIEMRDTWFPQPGIPTEKEIERLLKQIDGAEYLVIWTQYKEFDVWNSEDYKGAFKSRKGEFAVGLAQGDFTVLKRVAGGTTEAGMEVGSRKLETGSTSGVAATNGGR